MENEVIFRRSNRVVLRPLQLSDAPHITRWINDPRVTQYVNAYLPTTESEEIVWINDLSTRKDSNIVVMLVVDGTPIGTMGIHGINMRHRVATTGALIGEPEYWNKGYGSEAKMLLLEYAFNTLNLRKICSQVIAFNERSTSYSLKCGYKIEGRKKQEHFARGDYWDVIQLAVFKEDWLPIWKIFCKQHQDNLLF